MPLKPSQLQANGQLDWFKPKANPHGAYAKNFYLYIQITVMYYRSIVIRSISGDHHRSGGRTHQLESRCNTPLLAISLGPQKFVPWIFTFIWTLTQVYPWNKPRAPFAFKNSMIHEFCNSHYISRFAAFFIDVGAESSTVMPLYIYFR